MPRLVNVGCGGFRLGGFENIDLHEAPPEGGWPALPVIVADALQYDYRGAELVYAGHFLEHLTVSDARKFMAKVWADLSPGGTLAITVPAWDRCAAAEFETLQAMGGGEGRWPGDRHVSWWRTADVVREMKDAGFADVAEWADCLYVVARVPWQVCVRGIRRERD